MEFEKKQELSNDNSWKKALIYILDEQYVYIPRTAVIVDMDDVDMLHDFVGSFSSNIDKEPPTSTKDKVHMTNYAISMKNKLKAFGLISITYLNASGKEIKGIDSKKGIDLDSEEYNLLYEYLITINAKGLEVVLKLQEHQDNERRYKEQEKISKQLKINSTFSAATAFLALLVALGIAANAWTIRINQESYVRSLKKHQNKQLTISQEQLQLNKNKLKNGYCGNKYPKSIKVEITKPVDINIHKEDPDSMVRPECELESS